MLILLTKHSTNEKIVVNTDYIRTAERHRKSECVGWQPDESTVVSTLLRSDATVLIMEDGEKILVEEPLAVLVKKQGN